MRLRAFHVCRHPLRTCVAAAAVCILGNVSHAADVPAFGNWDEYHLSFDETPIRVSFVHEKGRRDFPGLTIPRSYVHYVHRGPPSSRGPLPATLETDQVQIAFTDPDGQAWSTSLRAQAAQVGTGLHNAGSALRAQFYKLTLSPTANPNMADDMRNQIPRAHKADGTHEGMARYRDTGTGVYFVPGMADEFMVVRCYDPVNPVYLCTAQFLLTEGVFAQAAFADFRAHGGIETLRRRIRFAREVACRFVEGCRQ